MPGSGYRGVSFTDEGSNLLISSNLDNYTYQWEFLSSKNAFRTDKVMNNQRQSYSRVAYTSDVQVWFGYPSKKVDLFQNGQWSSLPDYPIVTYRHCVTFIGEDSNYFYVLGGYDYSNGYYTSNVREFSFSTQKYR